jgi:GGDEF domain-containing protein
MSKLTSLTHLTALELVNNIKSVERWEDEDFIVVLNDKTLIVGAMVAEELKAILKELRDG